MFFKKLLLKSISLILALTLAVNPYLTGVVLAQEISPSPEPSQQPASSSQPPVSATTDATTGDASATSDNQNYINITQDNVPGNLTTGETVCTPPEGQTTCPSDINLGNDNSAVLDTTTTADATTGESVISGQEGDVDLTTSDATASGNTKDIVNFNEVNFEATSSASPLASPNPDITSGEGGSPNTSNPPNPSSSPHTLSVDNSNQADIKNEQTITATTGEDVLANNLGDVNLETGDALALTNLFNLINTNIIGSRFEIILRDLLAQHEGNVDLNQIWLALQAQEAQDSLALPETASSLVFNVENQNDVNLTNDVVVKANTGDDLLINNNSANLDSGNATALANVVNFMNVNLFGTDFLLSLINILGNNSDDIILPRPEYFNEQPAAGSQLPANLEWNNENNINMDNNLSTLANTGNSVNDNGSIITGSAIAISNSLSIVNFNLRGNNWFSLIVNRLGNWSGKVLGWSTPGTQEEQLNANASYQTGGESTESLSSTSLTTPNDPSALNNINNATLINDIQVEANTGRDVLAGNSNESELNTGNAKALGNLLNFVNVNILGGHWFMGIVNILGDWSGNLVFAYPDVVVDISGQSEATVGDTLNYTLTYHNNGYDTANGVQVQLNFPKGLNFVSDSSGFAPQLGGQVVSWNLPKLEAGRSGSFTVYFKAEIEVFNQVSWLPNLVAQAHAADSEKSATVKVVASIGTSDPEANSNNNSATAATIVYEKSGSDSAEDPSLKPNLEITAWNNVNDFVYPGDIVTFEITIKNTGLGTAHDAVLTQKLFNGMPEDFGTQVFNLGNIGPGKSGKLSFGLLLSNNSDLIPASAYRTVAQIAAKANNGDSVTSNEATTTFNVKLKSVSSNLVQEVVAYEEKSNVLAATDEPNTCPEKTENILPYVLLLMLSTLWIVEKGRLWRCQKSN